MFGEVQEGGFRGVRDVFLNETIRAYFLIRAPNIQNQSVLHDTKGYIQALTDYRTGDAGPIIELFIDATEGTINAEILAQDIETLRGEVLSIVSLKPSPAFPHRPSCTEPDFTARMVEESTRRVPELVRIAFSTAWWSYKFCVKNASNFRGKSVDCPRSQPRP